MSDHNIKLSDGETINIDAKKMNNLSDLISSLDKRLSAYELVDPIDILQFKTDKDRILNHQAEMKSDIKEIKKSIQDLVEIKNNDRLENLKKLNEIERDVEKINTKVAMFTSFGSAIGVVVGWLLSVFKIMN